MKLTFRPMSEAAALEITAWRYGGEYSLYDDGDPADVSGYLDPAYAYTAIFDEVGALVGYYCLGEDAQVPGGNYAAEAMDVGMGLRPDLTGRGMGAAILAAVLVEVAAAHQPPAFRATVAAFNQRAQHLCQRVGFRLSGSFTSTAGNRIQFVQLLKEASSDPRLCSTMFGEESKRMADNQKLSKQGLLGKIEDTHADFGHAFEGLSAERMAQPGIYSDHQWTVKDIIAHVTRWEQLQISWLTAEQMAMPPTTPPLRMWVDSDGMNERYYADDQDRPLADVLDSFNQSFQQMLTAVAALSDEQIASDEPFMATTHPLYDHIAANTFEHYPEHTNAILDWRNKEGI